MHYTPWIAFLAADRAHCQNLQLQIKLLFFVVVAVLARCQAIAITPTVSTSISRPNTPDNQRFPPPCGTTRRRVGVVTASKSILPRLSQFNEGEPHSATFWNSARLLPWRSRYQALKMRLLWQIDGYTEGIYHKLHSKSNRRLHLNPEPMATSNTGCWLEADDGRRFGSCLLSTHIQISMTPKTKDRPGVKSSSPSLSSPLLSLAL